MSPVILKWIAGVASVLCVMAVVAMLNMWSDVRVVKIAIDEAKANAIKAERIANLESDVENLEKDLAKQDASHSAMWQAIGRKADK